MGQLTARQQMAAESLRVFVTVVEWVGVLVLALLLVTVLLILWQKL
jgi:hypothetical protein